MRFWVHENLKHKRARIHRGECTYCDHGLGVQGAGSGRNDRWHGPFADRDSAGIFADRLTQPDTKPCDICQA